MEGNPLGRGVPFALEFGQTWSTNDQKTTKGAGGFTGRCPEYPKLDRTCSGRVKAHIRAVRA